MPAPSAPVPHHSVRVLSIEPVPVVAHVLVASPGRS
jgi:hypothetical protein